MHYQPSCQVEKTEESKLIDIVQTKRNITQMKQQLHEQITALYPLGADIAWQKGGNNVSGTVMMHDHGGERLKVENELTQTCYWINIYDVLKRHGLSDRIFA